MPTHLISFSKEEKKITHATKIISWLHVCKPKWVAEMMFNMSDIWNLSQPQCKKGVIFPPMNSVGWRGSSRRKTRTQKWSQGNTHWCLYSLLSVIHVSSLVYYTVLRLKKNQNSPWREGELPPVGLWFNTSWTDKIARCVNFNETDLKSHLWCVFLC